MTTKDSDVDFLGTLDPEQEDLLTLLVPKIVDIAEHEISNILAKWSDSKTIELKCILAEKTRSAE